MNKADRKVLRTIKRQRPAATREALALALGVSIPQDAEIGSGAFRRVYLIPGTNLVAKVPFAAYLPGSSRNVAARRDSKLHSTQEVKRIEKLRETPFMRRFLPTVRYHDRKTGLLIMDYIAPIENKDGFGIEDQAHIALIRFTQGAIKDLTGVDLSDISIDNLSLSKRGDIIFLDLGL